MRVVVTGAFGFIGLALLDRLAPAHQIVAVGHPPRRPAPVPDGVEVVHGDATIAAGYLDEDTALVHLAGGGGAAHVREDPVGALRNIVGLSAALVAATDRVGYRVRLLASTIAVYGTASIAARPYRETDEAAADDLYGVCKEVAESIWTANGRGTALRLANVYGVGIGLDVGIQGAIERFARAAASGGDLTVYGDGRQRIDYVNVEDVCSAFEAALSVPEGTLPPAINIGSGSPVAIGEVARACVRAAEDRGLRPTIRRVPAPEGKLWPDRALSIELAERTLGWVPRIDLRTGIEGLIDMMRAA